VKKPVQFNALGRAAWDNYGPAHLAGIRAVTAFEYHGWHHGWTAQSSWWVAISPFIDKDDFCGEWHSVVIYFRLKMVR
jgi:hypothetical protein